MPFALILSVGIDSQLLDSRQLLLQSAGYAVVSAHSAKDAVDRFLAGDFDLVLLCHSLSERERDGLACLIRASGALTPVITVATYDGQQDVFASATIECEPGQLLAGIRDALTNQHQKRASNLLAFRQTG
jgi:CheY-like chemotaxis protein